MNELYWPSDVTEWAQGHFLVTDTQLSCIRGITGDTVFNEFVIWDEIGANTTTSTTTTTTSVERCSGPSRVSAQLAIVGVHPLMDVSDGEKLHLLTLVDRRFFWWYKNCPASNYLSWDDLFSAGLTSAGVGTLSQVIDPIPLDLSVPSGRWNSARFVGFPLPVYLDAAAQMSQRRIVCRMDETVHVQSPDLKRADDQNQFQHFSCRLRMGGEAPLYDLIARQPSKVKVYFYPEAGSDECTVSPAVEEVTLESLTSGYLATTTQWACDDGESTTTTPGTTTTTNAGAPCRYQYGYDASGNLWGPDPWADNPACCPSIPPPESQPPPTGTPFTNFTTAGSCGPVTTTTTCSEVTTTTTNAFSPPSLDDYQGFTGIPETSVILWADSGTASYSLARRLARDWYLWRLTQVEASFTGPIDWQLNGTSDALVYRHTHESFDTRVLRVPFGPDNVIASGINCDAVTEQTTTTTQACTGTATLINQAGRWVVESSDCSCGCEPSFPADCPDDTSTCERRVVPCSRQPAPPPLCVTTTTTTTTTPYIGPPTTTTTPYCPPDDSHCGTTTTSAGCPSCAGVVNGCAWWTGVFGVPPGQYAGCWIGGACCPGPNTSSDVNTGVICSQNLDPTSDILNCNGEVVVVPTPCCPPCNPPFGPFPPCTIVYSDCPPYTPPPPDLPVPCSCSGGCIYYADTYLDEWIPDSANVCACKNNFQGCGIGCTCLFPQCESCPPHTGPCSCDAPSDPPSAMGVTACGAAIGFPCLDRTPVPPGYDPNTDPCNPGGGTTTTPYQPADLCDVRGCTWYAALAGDPWTLQESFCELDCACLSPSFDSTVDCQTVNTSCIRGDDVTTTTSACTGGCFYSIGPGGTVLVSNTCSVGCSCPTVPVNPIDLGIDTLPGYSFVSGDCGADTPPTTTTTTTNACTGDCVYSVTYDSNGDVTDTSLLSNTCSVGCDCPNVPENSGTIINLRPVPGTQIVVGTCMVGSPPVTTTTTTTTTTQGCSGACWVTFSGGVVTSINGDCALAVDCGCDIGGTTYEVSDSIPTTCPDTDEGPGTCVAYGTCAVIP